MRWIFWGFCRNWFLIDPLHYLSSRSNFGFKFTGIFIMEKRLADSASRQLSDSASRGVDVSPSRRVGFRMFLKNSASRKVGDSSTRRVGESLTPRLLESDPRLGELNFLKFIIKLQHFKWLNQPFKGPI
jgi:hypothetical protein